MGFSCLNLGLGVCSLVGWDFFLDVFEEEEEGVGFVFLGGFRLVSSLYVCIVFFDFSVGVDS